MLDPNDIKYYCHDKGGHGIEKVTKLINGYTSFYNAKISIMNS